MNRSFYNGVSGSKTYMYGMDTLANNIANVNTVGFKGKETEFATVFSQTLTGAGLSPTQSQVGLGSRVNATALDLGQGSIVQSDGTFDLAVAGDGWFALSNGRERVYTRNGEFRVNAAEYLTTASGLFVQGVSGNVFRPDPDNPGGYLASPLDEIVMTAATPTGNLFLPGEVRMPGEATRTASFKGNLNPTVEIGNVRVAIPQGDVALQVDPATNLARVDGAVAPSETILDPAPGQTVEVTILNALGESVEATTTLDANLRWSVADLDVSGLDPANQGPLRVEAHLHTRQGIPNEGRFQMPVFTTNGERAVIDMRFTQRLPLPERGSVWDAQVMLMRFYEKYDPETVYNPEEYYVDEGTHKVYRIIDRQEGVIRFDENGALAQNTVPTLDNAGVPLQLNLGTPYDPALPDSGYDGLTTFANLPTAGTASTHDGYEAGFLKGYQTAQDGTIYANFSNGKSVAAAKIPLYHFPNDQGLESEENVFFRPSVNSGDPFLYTDGSGRVVQGGSIHSYALESSNVQLSEALTEMILMQKAFDANAKSITTSDQMIQKAINMKK